MTEPFAEIVGPTIRYIVGLQQGFERGEHPDLDRVHTQLLNLLTEAEQKAARSSGLVHDFALARQGRGPGEAYPHRAGGAGPP